MIKTPWRTDNICGKVSMNRPTLEKSQERAEIEAQLAEWLGQGNEIQTVPFGTLANDRAEPGGDLITKGTSR